MSTLDVEAAKPKSATISSSAELLLQRKCGNESLGVSGECELCKKKHLQKKLSIGTSNDPLELEADRVADQVMAMPPNGGVCSAPSRIQRLTRQACGEAAPAPASVEQVLASSGQPLDPALEQDMGQRFGYDFSHVRVHTGAEAEQSARDVNAHAYTVGHNIVFGAGQFVPEACEGRRLVAHELAHVTQQGATSPGPTRVLAQRTPNMIDARAQTLINVAQDTSVAIDQRAQRLVTQILATYYPSDASKFTQINWVETDPGVTAVCASTGTPTMTCTMAVGRYFVEHTTSSGIARRVLQIGHEIQHVNQHRQGMGGGGRRHEREFLSFHWEAAAPEAAGTGRMPHATRVGLIDAAIQHYNCFTAAEKTTYNTQYQQLLTLRQSEQTASGNPATPVPTQCSG